MNVSGHFSVIFSHEIFVKLNLPILPVLAGKGVKSQKYFDCLPFN